MESLALKVGSTKCLRVLEAEHSVETGIEDKTVAVAEHGKAIAFAGDGLEDIHAGHWECRDGLEDLECFAVDLTTANLMAWWTNCPEAGCSRAHLPFENFPRSVQEVSSTVQRKMPC